MRTLNRTAVEMVAPAKGILAADESTGTLTRRFASHVIDSTADSRRAYREMLFTTPGLADHTSGVILYDETFHQRTSDGRLFPSLLEDLGVLPGIKVDTGAKPLAGCPEETVTEGLDGLRERLEAYAGLGARFAKWRAVIAIGDGRPSRVCLSANAHALARYAALCQEAGIVPIVEPEVLMDGRHPLGRAAAVTEETLRTVFAALADQDVDLEGIVLKPNMVVPGRDARRPATEAEVADATLTCLRRTVPAAVPGVAFLSGGQSPDEATGHLRAMVEAGPHPWQLTFSFGRALQDPALAAWGGSDVAAGQAALADRLRRTAAARCAPVDLADEPLLEPAV
ncbi:MAG: class I fructose-bisphosphate aldolase [Actinomycetota bacterium]|jgi:fructose-bisphosphate aldolase, class I